MGGWIITCGDNICARETKAAEIVDLINNHCDPQGWFVCGTCGCHGYVANGVNPIGWTVTGLKLEYPPGWLN